MKLLYFVEHLFGHIENIKKTLECIPLTVRLRYMESPPIAEHALRVTYLALHTVRHKHLKVFFFFRCICNYIGLKSKTSAHTVCLISNMMWVFTYLKCTAANGRLNSKGQRGGGK